MEMFVRLRLGALITERAYALGRTKAARWFLGKRPPELTSGLTGDLTDIDKSDEVKNDE